MSMHNPILGANRHRLQHGMLLIEVLWVKLKLDFLAYYLNPLIKKHLLYYLYLLACGEYLKMRALI